MGLIKVSACIVTYNNADKICRTIKSILAVTKGVDFQLYVSDNDSSDNTVELVKREFPQVIVLENKTNKGFGHGNNAVISKLNSKYHFIINPDIFLKENAVLELVKFLENNSDIVMAVPKFVFENGEEQFTPKLQPTLRYMLGGRLSKYGLVFKKWRDEYTLKNVEIKKPIDIGFCSGCFIAVRTDVFKKIKGFDERYFLYSEDADITRMAQKYGRTVYNPSVSVIHLWERAYKKSGRHFRIQIASMFKYFWKWRFNGRYVK